VLASNALQKEREQTDLQLQQPIFPGNQILFAKLMSKRLLFANIYVEAVVADFVCNAQWNCAEKSFLESAILLNAPEWNSGEFHARWRLHTLLLQMVQYKTHAKR